MKLYYKRVDFRVMSHCFNLSTLSTIFQNQKAGWLLANQHSKVGVGRRSVGRGKQIANWAIWATIKNFCVKVMYTQCLCSSQLTMQLRQAKQVWDEPCYVREAKRRLSNVSYIKNFCKGYMKYIPNRYLILTGPTKAGVVLWLCCARETNRKSSTINQLSPPRHHHH